MRSTLKFSFGPKSYSGETLHDSAGQTLAALGMNLAQLAADAKDNPANFAKGLKDAQDLV
jgi:signal transduction histidine kinase